MPEDYDSITAKHYAAYRPSLHTPILSRCLSDGEHFRSGLDVGCGTGRSTIALANYCDSVIGIDPSKEMLGNAIQSTKIKYVNGLLEESNLALDSFDIITFAGVLFYSKSQLLYDEVIRISKRGAKIIIYDFEVVLTVIFNMLDLPTNISTKSDYDHEINFSGLNDGQLSLISVVKNKVNLNVSPSNLTHLVLAEKKAYQQLKLKYGSKNIFKNIQSTLRSKTNGENLAVQANLFYSLYENIK